MAFYITTPLFYVNDLPHIGSAYPTMAADFVAGHMIQRGEDVCFLTGTDEHGQKIEKAAREKSKSPKDHCDYISGEFKKLWQILDIQYHKFIRTSSESHKDFVTEFFKKVQANGDIYKGVYTGLYCVSCEDFWLEKDLAAAASGSGFAGGSGDPVFFCPIHKKPVEYYEQDNYFFALSKYQDKLQKYINDNPDFISPDYRRNEVLGWLKEGLKDFPISRTNLEWGIDVPDSQNHDKQKIYVWFDALLGYISGLGADRDKYWSKDSQIIHIIGKDILRFHAVYWPAMLMSADYPLPKMVFGHGFLTKDGAKMGKTLGNIIDPIALVDEYGSDAVRFYFLRELVFGRDGDFTLDNFIQRLNTDLANNLGNLLNRSLNLVQKSYDGRIPVSDFDSEIAKIFVNLEKSFVLHMNKFNAHAALDELFISLNKVNAFFNDAAPWKLLKEGKNNEAAKYIFTALEACRRSAIFLAPLCPNLANKIMQQLGLLDEASLNDRLRYETLAKFYNYKNLSFAMSNVRITSELKPVFNRIELVKA